MPGFQARIDLANPTYAKFVTHRPLESIPDGPDREAAAMCCSNQKIATTGTYQNFQFFGVMIVISVCAFLILVSLALDFTVAQVRKRWVTPVGTARQLARDHDNRYWLLRVALQGSGVQHWRRSGSKRDNPLPIVDQGYDLYSPGLGPDQDDFYRVDGVSEAEAGQHEDSRPASVEKS